VFIPRFTDAPVKGTLEQRWFYLGAILSSWTVWQLTSILGIALGSFVPTTWSLDFAAVLALIAMMMPLVSNKPILVAIFAAALVAWLTQPWPLRLGLIAAVVVGSMAGMWAEKVFRKGRAS
jgi:predicted branched-subunit amino acid permease